MLSLRSQQLSRKKYYPPMPLPVPPDYHKKLYKKGQMTVNSISPSTLKMILKTHYPLPVKQQPLISPPLDIPPSPSPLPSAEPGSLGDDQINGKENSLKARVDNDMAGKHGKMEPDRSDGDK